MEQVLNQALQLPLPIRLLLIEQLVKSVQAEVSPTTQPSIKKSVIREMEEVMRTDTGRFSWEEVEAELIADEKAYEEGAKS